MIRKLAWKPDIPDQRDYKYSNLVQQKLISTAGTLPSRINLRRWCSEVEDQQYLGSCTANAIVGMIECRRNYEKKGGLNFSRLFNYYNERVFIHMEQVDSGAYLRDGVKSARMSGICLANDWPYDLRKWKTEPSDSAYRNAINYRISKYCRINTLDEMKLSLATGRPFVFGFAVYDSFMSQQVASTGIVPMPSSGERMLGGHAVMAIGYDDVTGKFLVRNSWGKRWGLKDNHLQGYCWMPYDYLTNRGLSNDFWTIYL